MILDQHLITAAAPVRALRGRSSGHTGLADQSHCRLLFSQAMAQLPAEGDDASQSPVNFSAPYKGPLNGPSCPRIKHYGVMAPHQDQWSMELPSWQQLCVLATATSRWVSTTRQVLVVALGLAQHNAIPRLVDVGRGLTTQLLTQVILGHQPGSQLPCPSHIRPQSCSTWATDGASG